MGFFLESFQILFQPLSFILLFLACVLGIFLGAVPGLNGGLGVALILPLTFGMSPEMGITLLVGVWIGGVSGGLIGSILLGIPGSPSSIATTFDGYPLSQKGETVKALGIGIIASFFGTVLSVMIAALLSPLIADLAFKLGPWEYFALVFCAITLVAGLSEGNIYKALASAFLGILLSSVGFSPIDGYSRFTFENMYFSGGLDLIALLLGIFAIRQIANDYGKGQQHMPEVKVGKISGFGVTLKELKDNTMNMIRSFGIGIGIGFLPGMGSGLSNIVAYAQAKKSSKNPDEFGKGSIEGIFASETSNNAAVGGAMIPMISLGIPGDGVTAILLGGLMMQGFQPGPLLAEQSPNIVNFLFSAALLSAFVVLFLQFFGMRFFPLLLKIPYKYLYPTILVLCFIGAFSSTNHTFNFVLLIGFGLLGLLMDYAKIPVTPFLLAFILGPLLELNLRKGLTYSEDGFITFLTRPVSGMLILVGVLILISPVLKRIFWKWKESKNSKGTISK